MVNNGTACRKTVYGSFERGIPLGFLAAKSRMMEKITQTVTDPSQSEVHIESWYLRLLRGVCLGSGRKKTSNGRVRPSRGRRESVRDCEWTVIGIGGGGCGRFCCGGTWNRCAGGLDSDEEDEADEADGTGDTTRRGEPAR